MAQLWVFPGQGSQQVGMGRRMAEQFPTAAELFVAARETLGWDVAGVCFEGPEEELRRTAVAQPALLVASLACLAPLRQAGLRPDVVAGHSLGEYTALVAAGALSPADGVRLVAKRGAYMERAARESTGGMAAILGLETEQVERLCEETGATLANRNAPGQAVISGATEVLERAMERARAEGARRVVALNVAGAFHSPCMAAAADAMRGEIEQADIRRAEVPVIANVTAAPVREPAEIRAALVEQLTGVVRWEESVRRAAAMGVDVLVEIGPGSVLTGLARRIEPGLSLHNVADPEGAVALMGADGREPQDAGLTR